MNKLTNLEHYEVCVDLYSDVGESAIYDYIEKKEIDCTWEYCEPCESVQPFLSVDKANTCMVCGSVNELSTKILNRQLERLLNLNDSYMDMLLNHDHDDCVWEIKHDKSGDLIDDLLVGLNPVILAAITPHDLNISPFMKHTLVRMVTLIQKTRKETKYLY